MTSAGRIRPPFLDTNVLIYAFTEDPRASIAEAVLAEGGVVGINVLNEFCSIARRKLGMSWSETRTALAAIQTLCPNPVPITASVHEAALDLAETHHFSIYDAVVVAAALAAECSVLLSEDLQHGQTIARRLTVRNPFKA